MGAHRGQGLMRGQTGLRARRIKAGILLGSPDESAAGRRGEEVKRGEERRGEDTALKIKHQENGSG